MSSSSSVNQSNSLSNNTLNSQRKYPGNSIRPIVVQNNVSGRKNSNSMKEQEGNVFGCYFSVKKKQTNENHLQCRDDGKFNGISF